MERKDRRRIENQLRGARPQPRDEFVRALAAEMAPRRAQRPGFGLRVAVSGGLTAVMLVALGAVGGIGYAASAAQQAAHVVKKAFVPSANKTVVAVSGLTAGGDQYKPGFGFGDPNHNHAGPPGLSQGGGNNGGGAFTPPAQTTPIAGGKAVLAKTSITLDEQATLYIQVVNAKGKPVLITQKGSKVGGALDGKQAKTLVYKVLVPRTIPLQLRLPSNLLKSNTTYKIRIVAKDPSGKESKLLIPLSA